MLLSLFDCGHVVDPRREPALEWQKDPKAQVKTLHKDHCWEGGRKGEEKGGRERGVEKGEREGEGREGVRNGGRE